MKKISVCLVIILLATILTGVSTAYDENISNTIDQSYSDSTKYFVKTYGATTFTEKTEKIAYTNRTDQSRSVALFAPTYVISGVTCVPTAGTTVLGFYDLFYPDLIPNFTAGTIVYGMYNYYPATTHVTTAALQLAKDMGLNDPATDGATVSNFKTGMQIYCQRKGLSISAQSCMNSGSFNYTLVKEYVNNLTPVVIFTTKFNIGFIETQSNTDTVHSYIATEPHAMFVYGYSEYTYTLSNGQTKTNRYLQVSSGLGILDSALVNIDADILINDAYAVTIY
ncbi:MAG: hypothetical protein J1F65_06365 [Clostridiales bacterium]|nr:hypothetical protein [Clostridiales bacterium]